MPFPLKYLELNWGSKVPVFFYSHPDTFFLTLMSLEFPWVNVYTFFQSQGAHGQDLGALPSNNLVGGVFTPSPSAASYCSPGSVLAKGRLYQGTPDLAGNCHGYSRPRAPLEPGLGSSIPAGSPVTLQPRVSNLQPTQCPSV